MFREEPKHVPVEIFPGDWCIWCDDAGHTDRPCPMLVARPRDGAYVVERCGCTDNLVLGVAGGYVIRITQVQRE